MKLMNNKLLVICGGLLLLIFLVFGTYVWYLYFLRISSEFVVNNNSKYLETSGIIFQDDGHNVYNTDAESVADNKINDVPAYTFQVTNTNKSRGKYNIYIEDMPINAINDGCTEETLLTRNDLKYQLSLNGKTIKEGFMTSINDNILDTREINANSTNYYSLKIYIHDEALNWFGKHYHYKVSLNR